MKSKFNQSKSRIAKTKTKVKNETAEPKKDWVEKDEAEISVKKAQESYRNMLCQPKDPEQKKIEWPYRFSFSLKMWYQVMKELTPTQRIVYLCYCATADFKTGLAILSARKQGSLMKITKDTFCQARNQLVKKGFLEKGPKARNCFYYKILKTKK